MIFRRKRILWTALAVAGVCTASAIIDRDFDGMSDIWEAHFGLPTDDDGIVSPEQGPEGDLDGDGWTNLQESIAGTNPELAQPPEGMLQTQITQNPLVPGVFVVSWPTLVGKKYTLMVSPDMSSESWTQVGDPAIGDGSPIPMAIDLTENTPIPDKLFWRVAVADVDTDGDGLSDYEEGVVGTNLALADTDGDGDLDGEEVNSDTAPLDPSSYTVKVVGSFPNFHGDNSYAGYSCSQPVLLYFNHVLPSSVTAITNSWLVDLNGESPETADGVTVILPGRKGIAFIPTGNSFPAWSEDEEDLTPPAYQINFTGAATGIPHLLEFVKSFTITTASGSAGTPSVDAHSPGSNFIDVDCSASITTTWNEPLDSSTVIPANVSLVPVGGSPVTCTVSFDYTNGVNKLTIVPSAALAPATLYTITLGTGFTNLTSKAHAQAVSWSFTTRPLRSTPATSGPYVVSVTPTDFAFGISPPTSVSITFSEEMEASTLIAGNVHLAAGYSSDLPGTYTYTSATKTLEFVPTSALPAGQYFTLTLDLGSILSAPSTGSPQAMQGNGTFVFGTTPVGGGSSGGSSGGGGAGSGGAGAGGGAPPPGTIAPMALHYTWGKLFAAAPLLPPEDPSGSASVIVEPDGDAGCTVEIKTIDKIGGEKIKTLPADTKAVQVQDSGPIDPATTVVITPALVLGTNKDKSKAAAQCGVLVSPSDGYVAPGMLYLVLRKTPASSSTSDPATVEYLGVFGGTDSFAADCGNGTDKAAQSLYLIPVPVERKLPGAGQDWNLIENQYAKALPGHKINLRLEDKFLATYGPPGVTLDTFVWNLPGKSFKDFDPDEHNSSYQDVPISELIGDREIHFYWASPGNKKPSVTFLLNINGSPINLCSASSELNITKIKSDFTTQCGSARVDTFAELPQSFGYFGASSRLYGVRFVGAVTTPVGEPNGKWHWVQLITSKRIFSYPDGSSSHLGDGITKKLDFRYPYFPNPPTSTPADGTVIPGIGDSPSEAIGSRTRIEIKEDFETYQMFCPSGIDTRYVPLRRITWHWGGVVTSSDSWSSVASPYSACDPSGTEWSDHPKWSENSNMEGSEIIDTPAGP